jgi:hypothetical protein
VPGQDGVIKFYCKHSARGILHTGTLQRQNAKNLKRKGISGRQSQFPHSCICERIIYSHDGSAFSAGGNMWSLCGPILGI